MIKNNLKKVVALLLSMSCILTNVSALGVSAEEDTTDISSDVIVLNEEDNGQPPKFYNGYTEVGLVPCGDKVPSTSNIWNLSYNSYGNGSVKASFKHVVYTNYCFTFNKNNSRIHADLNGDSLFQYFRQYCPNHYIDVELHEYYTLTLLTGNQYYDRVVKNVHIVNTSNSAGAVFENLENTNNARYYVKFSKPMDGFEVTNVDVNISLI